MYFENEEEFIKKTAEYILDEALSSVLEKGFFTISLTGGSTPPKIYDTLTKSPYRENFPWEKTYFFLGDERILPKENPDSNIFMINQSLFSKVDIQEENIIFPDTNINNPQEIAKEYEIKIKEFFKSNKLSFDLFLLGMGPDCHTASLFPSDSVWKDSKSLVLSTSKPFGNPEVYRVSMGLELINKSKQILMMISGENKRPIAEKLLKNIKENKNPLNSPIVEIKSANKFTWHIN